MDNKESKWAKAIISLQSSDGSWGYFHTLSAPTPHMPITTEQALRRLQILGFSINDLPIKRAVSYMHRCLVGEKHIPDRREKLHNWDAFTSLILSTWIRRFTLENNDANKVAEKWSRILKEAFITGSYVHDNYINAFIEILQFKPRGARFIDFVSFYQISLLSDMLDKDTEIALFDYILNHNSGIYYVYDKCLALLPQNFNSKQASRYLGAIELLSE